MADNLRVEQVVVGPHRGGIVIPISAIEGGRAEADRLVAMGALSWTDEPLTVLPKAEPPKPSEAHHG